MLKIIIKENFYENIGSLLMPVITRRRSWLNAALIYAKNYEKIFEVIHGINKSKILIENFRNAIFEENIRTELNETAKSYLGLVDAIDKGKKNSIKIKDIYDIIKNLRSHTD